mgnify:CR=1 FL=1
MKYINKEQWDTFLNAHMSIYYNGIDNIPEDLNKGIMFEHLVEKLLASMFDNSSLVFNRTKASHDGSKDFWAIDEDNNVWWAECKNFTPNISLTQLAPTLIMAEINNVHYLFFFSYSKLNDNLKRRIAQYTYMHHKEVFLFDDESLESLLFFYKKEQMVRLLQFPENLNTKLEPEIETHFFNEVNAQAMNRQTYHGYYDIPELQVGGIYDLNVLMINRNLQENCRVFLSIANQSSEDTLCFEILLDESMHELQEFELKPNQVKLGKISVKVIKHKSQLRLPQLKVEVEYDSCKLVKQAPIKVCDCIWTKKAVLIGAEYENILDTFRKECLNNKYISGLMVYGAGGTGKTRILEECCSSLIKNDYKIFNFTGFDTNNSWKDVIREITFELFEIAKDICFEVMCNIKQKVASYIDDPIKREIYEFLYMLSDNNLSSEKLENNYRIIYKKLQQQKSAIIIDNLQSYDPHILHFFTKMIQFYSSCRLQNPLALLFSINTSLVFDNKYLDFIADFEILNQDTLKTCFISKQIRGFKDENNAIAFLKTILKLDEYPLNFYSLKQILQKASHKPKYIELVADYLLQLDCIEIKNEKGVIKKNHLLKRELECIPDRYEKLFGKMYRLMVENSQQDMLSFKTFISVLYLFQEVDDRLIDVLNLNREVAHYLVQHNIIKDSSHNCHCYIFEHDLIEICLSKDIYTDLLEHALKYISGYEAYFKTILKDKYIPYILYELYFKKVSLNEIIEINLSKSELQIPNKFLYKFYESLIQNLIIHKNELEKSVFISEISSCCKYVRDHISEMEAKNLFAQAMPHVFDISLTSLEIVRQHFSFVIHYCENRNRLQEPKESIKFYRKYLAILEALKKVFPEATAKLEYAEAYIHNRIFVCGKLEGKIDKYFENLKKSIRKALQKNFYDILFENYFDAANLYFQNNQYVKKGLMLLKKGFFYYESSGAEIKEKFIVNYYSKKIICYLIEGKLNEADALVQKALQEIQDNPHINYHIFFKGKYLRYGIIGRLLAGEIDLNLKASFEEYERFIQITQSEDDYDWYVLQAKYAFYLKNETVFRSMYWQCYSLFEQINYTKTSAVKEEHMINDLTVMYRRLYSDKSPLDSLNDGAEILSTANYILKMENKDFIKYCAQYKSATPVVTVHDKRDGYFL